MVGEIFQEILSSLALVAILVCLVTTVFVLVPCSDEVFKKGKSNSVTDKEKSNDRNHRNFRGIRDLGDLGEGRIIGLSGFLSKDDDHEEQLKFANLERTNTVGDDDKELFSVGEVLDELSERPISSSSQIREEEEEGLIAGDENGLSEAKMETTDKLNTERAGYHEEEVEEGFSFDDWEGIERSELEILFGKAVAFVSSKRNADLLDTNLKLKLYALHKVATEGPCHLSPPLALKLSARAKWYQP